MRVVAIFNSINGEVTSFYQGGFATFIRFSGCNLTCKYCDTFRAQSHSAGVEMSLQDIIKTVKRIGCKNITLTGGEPLLQDQQELKKLLYYFHKNGYTVTIETNGTQFPIFPKHKDVCYVMDWKLSNSGMDKEMKDENFLSLTESDWVKMVVGSDEDYEEAFFVKKRLQANGCDARFAFSPMGRGSFIILLNFTAQQLVEKLQADQEYDVLVNLQLHKLIWPNAGEMEV